MQVSYTTLPVVCNLTTFTTASHSSGVAITKIAEIPLFLFLLGLFGDIYCFCQSCHFKGIINVILQYCSSRSAGRDHTSLQVCNRGGDGAEESTRSSPPHPSKCNTLLPSCSGAMLRQGSWKAAFVQVWQIKRRCNRVMGVHPRLRDKNVHALYR